MATKLGRMGTHLKRFPLKNVTQTFGHMVLPDGVISQNHYTTTITVSISAKLCRVMRYLEKHL